MTPSKPEQPILTGGKVEEIERQTPIIAPRRWSISQVVSTVQPELDSNTRPASPIPFFHLLERLKTTPREGWRRFSINHGESIADHMYRMSIITMLAPKSLTSCLDINRCTKMALVHDMAESLVGDITPVDGISKGEKARRERDTMDFISRSLLGGLPAGYPAIGEELREIWREYEEGESLEAKFVHDVDKLELMLQMVEYEKRHKVDLGEFSHVTERIELNEVKEWAKEVLREREGFWVNAHANEILVHA